MWSTGRLDIHLCGLLFLVLQLASVWCRALPWPNGQTHHDRKGQDMISNRGVTTRTPHEAGVTGLEAEVQRLSMAVEQTYEELADLRNVVEAAGNNGRKHGHKHGSLKTTCRSAYTLWHGTVGKTLEYLDNFDVHCRHGEFLRQWRMTWGERENGKKQIRYVCCKFVSHKEEKSHRRRNAEGS